MWKWPNMLLKIFLCRKLWLTLRFFWYYFTFLFLQRSDSWNLKPLVLFYSFREEEKNSSPSKDKALTFYFCFTPSFKLDPQRETGAGLWRWGVWLSDQTNHDPPAEFRVTFFIDCFTLQSHLSVQVSTERSCAAACWDVWSVSVVTSCPADFLLFCFFSVQFVATLSSSKQLLSHVHMHRLSLGLRWQKTH